MVTGGVMAEILESSTTTMIIFTISIIPMKNIMMVTITGGVMAALLKAPRMKRRQAARVTEN